MKKVPNQEYAAKLKEQADERAQEVAIPVPSVTTPAPTGIGKDWVKKAGLFVALAALLAIVWMPAPQGRPAR